MPAAPTHFVSGVNGLPAVQTSWPVEAVPGGPEEVGSPTSYVALALEHLHYLHLYFGFS